MLRGDFLNVYKYLKTKCKEDGARLFSVVPSDGSSDFPTKNQICNPS